MKEILPAFLSCQGGSLSDEEKRLFAQYNPLGVCLFAKYCTNIHNRDQLRSLIKEIQEVLQRDDVLIAVDQEGGRVRRLLDPEFTAVTAAENIDSAETARMHAYLIAADLKSCGINMNFAPVLDVATPDMSAVLAGRCLSSDAHEVTILAQEMVNEYNRQGICSCVKHLPGHGRATSDPHLSLPVINASMAELTEDFYPFKHIQNAPSGMVAHVVLSAIDAKHPATTSKKVINEIIRGEIDFQGFLVSDAIVMGALNGSISERANACINAGCDSVCLGNADFRANVELCHSGIKMSEKAYERLENINRIVKCGGNFAEYEYVKNKYCAELKNIISYNYAYDATEVLNRLRKNN